MATVVCAGRGWQVAKVLAYLEDHETIDITTAMDLCDFARHEANSKLALWSKMEKLRRVSPGLYAPFSRVIPQLK